MNLIAYMWDDKEGLILELDEEFLVYGIQEGDVLNYEPSPGRMEVGRGLYKFTCIEHPDNPKDIEIIEALKYDLKMECNR